MITILLDSSNTKLTVGIADGKSVIDFVSYEAWQQQSEFMVDELDKILKKHNFNRKDIKDIIVAIGPGSYTGVRIAITIAKVMALALSIPVFEVSSLRVLKDYDKESICLINARSGRSYFGVYKGKEIIEEDQIKSNDDVLQYIALHPNCSIMGDVKYLNLQNKESNICEQMLLLKNCLKESPDCLSIKPVYMKD